MALDLSYVMFDTAAFSTVAGAEFLLFQVTQGADATHTEGFTNTRGSGAFPGEEQFVIEKLSVYPDYAVPKADVALWFRNSFLEVKVNDKSLFKTPLSVLVDASAYGGSDTTTAGANGNAVGLLGDGYELKRPITVPGQTRWVIRVIQGTAVTAGSSFIKILLHGTLSIPG
jgi:hypothetical protein